jgi:hypothetical protein
MLSLSGGSIFFERPAFAQAPQKRNFGHSLERFKKKIQEPTRTTPRIADGEIKIETNLVITDVLVVNSKGNALVGLKKEDFVITEDGVVRDIDIFAPGSNTDIPKSLVLIIELGGLRSWALRSIEAAKLLVDKLGPKDRMAIVSTRLTLVSDFTTDKARLKSTLESSKKEQWSGLHEYSTLVATLNELFSQGDRRQVVIQQSHGGELALLKPWWNTPIRVRTCKRSGPRWCERAFAFSDVIDTIERSRATIFTVVPHPQVVGLSREQQRQRSQAYLNELMYEIPRRFRGYAEKTEREKEEIRREFTDITVDEAVKIQTALIQSTGISGGYTSFLENESDADEIYDSIFKSMQYRYTLGFYPRNEAHDGKRRTVKIEVKGRPGYMVIGRKSYFAPDPNPMPKPFDDGKAN